MVNYTDNPLWVSNIFSWCEHLASNVQMFNVAISITEYGIKEQ